MILCFIIYLTIVSSVRSEGANYRVNSRGILFYFNGHKGFDLKHAEELCERMEGRLPSVHRLEDILFLKKMTGMAIWLGGRQVSNNTYAWDDKSGEDNFIFEF